MKKLSLFFIFCSLCFNAHGLESNSTYIGEDMAVITDWTDNDSGDGVSSQGTFDTQSSMRLLSGASESGNYSSRFLDYGSAPSIITISIKLYHSALGSRGDTDRLDIYLGFGAERFDLNFATDGLFFVDTTTTELGTNLVSTGVWQEWDFVINRTAHTFDTWLDGVKVGDAVGWLYSSSLTDGLFYMYQYGNTTANRSTYIDYIRIGDGTSRHLVGG